jgi:hypothetical protein
MVSPIYAVVEICREGGEGANHSVRKYLSFDQQFKALPTCFQEYFKVLDAHMFAALLSTWQLFIYLVEEWPEVLEVVGKLVRGEGLGRGDEEWIREVSEACGWKREDIVDELRNIFADPSARAERYRRLFEEYLRGALDYKERGDSRQAGEKLWGSALALIKFYASLKNVPIVVWSLGRVERFIASNVAESDRRVFGDLLDKTFPLHTLGFYEGELAPEVFEQRWVEALEALGRARRVVDRDEKRPNVYGLS